MENNNLVSVIMPAYNSEKSIVDSINSVLSQTYSNLELIIIDDCSTDNTKNIIKNFSEIDSRIKCLNNSKNKGVSETRNLGIRYSVGNWIAFLDSDDIWHEKKLEQQLKFAIEKNSGFIFTGSSYIDSMGQKYPGMYIPPKTITYNELLKQNVITCSSVLIKKNYLHGLKMEKDNLHEDYILWLKILSSGIKAHGLQSPLVIYRISIESKSGNKLKSIKMTYGVFRYLNIKPWMSIFYTFRHLLGAFIKYKKIYKK